MLLELSTHCVTLCQAIIMYENSTHWGNILWDDIKTLCYTKLYYVERLKGLMNIQHMHTQAICYEKISTHDVTLCQALQNYEHATHLKIIFE